MAVAVASVVSWSDPTGSGLVAAQTLPGGCSVGRDALGAGGVQTLEPGRRVAVWWSRVEAEERPFRADRTVPRGERGWAEPYSDGAMLTALRQAAAPDRAPRPADPGDARILSAHRIAPDAALLRFSAVGSDEVWAADLPLPSSGRLKPWLYRTPVDAADSVGMLEILLDEETVTTAVRRAARDGDGRLILASYGFELADRAEHERLLGSSGPDGWSGRQTEGGPLGPPEECAPGAG